MRQQLYVETRLGCAQQETLPVLMDLHRMIRVEQPGVGTLFRCLDVVEQHEQIGPQVHHMPYVAIEQPSRIGGMRLTGRV